MLKKFQPTWMLDTILQISPDQAHKHHIKAIITDLDNTLIPWNSAQVPEYLKQWAEEMTSAGIEVLILSNNNGLRVADVAKQLGVQYLAPAYKPRSSGYLSALKVLDLAKEEVAFVGDQLLTDVFGANRVGIRTILVKPVVKTDGMWTRVNRGVEKPLKYLLDKFHKNWEWRNQLDDR